MNTQQEAAEREAFEAWCREEGLEPTYWQEGSPRHGYAHARVMDYWIGWQARATLSQQGGASAEFYESTLEKAIVQRDQYHSIADDLAEPEMFCTQGKNCTCGSDYAGCAHLTIPAAPLAASKPAVCGPSLLVHCKDCGGSGTIGIKQDAGLPERRPCMNCNGAGTLPAAEEDAVVSVQAAWQAAGGNPEVVVSEKALMDALRNLDAIRTHPIEPESASQQGGGAVAMPVAWTSAAMLASAAVSRERAGPFDLHCWSGGPTSFYKIPLYAAPPSPQEAREPLTDAEIFALSDQHLKNQANEATIHGILPFARAVIAATAKGERG